ncbi:MAG: prolyl oligopeptidase family serine peptidase [Actinomycetota bacterium]|nr:prolyl oligopeptidase family serine peptidase [Actinomycetota bacterium]
MRESFPRQSARTQRFSLGRPRSFTVAPDGSRVVFVRSSTGDDPVNRLWMIDLPAGEERLVFDPPASAEELSPEERARRERAREAAGGVVSYATDRDVTRAVLTLGGEVRVIDLRTGEQQEWTPQPPAFDPRLDPTGTRVAYVGDRTLRLLDPGGENRLLAGDAEPDLSWGLAEHVAAEEMGRFRGFWWSPDGSRIAATRVDERMVTSVAIFDAIDPLSEPRTMRYPLAGTRNAEVTLWVVGLDGSRTEVRWDRERFEYLARVVWPENGPLTLLVQSRDQRLARILTVDAGGETRVIREQTDDAWVELVEGSPAYTSDGQLVTTIDDDWRRLVVGDETVTPPGLQVRRILDSDDAILFVASEDPTEEHVWRWAPDAGLERLTASSGVHTGTGHGEVVVITSETLDGPASSTLFVKGEPVHTFASHAEEPVIGTKPVFFSAGRRELRSALLTPNGEEPTEPLPVLLDPYGGPWFQRVMKARFEFLESQWFADQGFAVLVIDGRGTPGRGREWELGVRGDLYGPTLEDQVDGLHAAAERYPFLDLERVAIRGWSFGGGLAAFGVLRRPDVFRAAVVGAPVTDERLYDTHYTERYLGHPDENPDAYRTGSVLPEAATLERPMLLIHGIVDDNCLIANALRLSQALTEAGRPHTFVPLSGITHRPNKPEVAENLLLLQVAFLKEALGLEG